MTDAEGKLNRKRHGTPTGFGDIPVVTLTGMATGQC